MSLAEPLEVTFELTTTLAELGLRYVVGGSIASSLHGVPRSTQDIDLVVDLPGQKVDAFVDALSDRFYVDRDMILDAIRRRASFNVLHLKTMFKVDVFIYDRSELVTEEFTRAQPIDIEGRPLVVCSPKTSSYRSWIGIERVSASATDSVSTSWVCSKSRPNASTPRTSTSGRSRWACTSSGKRFSASETVDDSASPKFCVTGCTQPGIR